MNIIQIMLLCFVLASASGGYFYSQHEKTFEKPIDKNISVTEVVTPTWISPTPIPSEPSERALTASIRIFLLLDDEERQKYTKEYSNDGDIKDAVRNFAVHLDSSLTLLSKAEELIANTKNTNNNTAEKPTPTIAYTYKNDNPSFTYQVPPNNINQSSDTDRSNTTINGNTKTNKINIVGESSSYTQYGNTLYGSDGDTYTRYGNTIYGQNGSTYTQYGNTVYGNDGSYYTKYGNTIYGNDGSTYTTYGNTTYGSDGSRATQYGDTTYLNK